MSNLETWGDERITAYVMNELSPDEKTQFENELEENNELAVAVTEARAVTDRLNEFYAAMPAATLDENRREEITNAAVANETFRPDSGAASGLSSASSRKRFALWAIAASVLFLGLALPAMMNPPGMQTAMTNEKDSQAEVAMRTTESADARLDESPAVEDEELSMPSGSESVVLSSPDDAGMSQTIGLDVGGSLDDFTPDLEISLSDDREAKAAPFSTIAPTESAPTGNTVIPGLMSDREATRSPRRRGMGMDMEMGMGMDGDMGMDMEMDMDMMGMEADSSTSGTGMSKSTEIPTTPQLVVPGDYGLRPEGPMIDRFSLEKSRRRLDRSQLLETKPGMAEAPDIKVVKNVTDLLPDLLSVLESDEGTRPRTSGDKFSPITENEFQRVSEHPLSTLSIDVDTASYSKVRSYLKRNQLPRPDSVRIEEMINYFDYDYADPVATDGEGENRSSDPFAAAIDAVVCPWETNHRLVRVGLQAKELTKKERPRCNLVFLIDTSGSMSSADKLPLVIEGMKLLLKQLRKDDRVAIVVYAGSAGLVLDSTPVKQRKKIVRALGELKSGGSTNGGAGLQLAYETARENFMDDGVNRVILCSDGDFNVGMTGTDALVREAKSQAKSGVDLTVLGFGMGNHNDAMMEQISNDAEGNYAFVDSIAEARKVLSDQLTGTLVTVAKDVKIQIEFNPAMVSAYRLIGYENRLLAKEDFNDDTKDAGEIGAGHRVTALYEVVPKGVDSAALSSVDPLKYQPKPDEEPKQQDADETAGSTEVLTLKLRFKSPQGDTSVLMTRVLADSQTPFAEADLDFRFAAAVAGFAMQLRGSEFAGSWTLDNVIEVAKSATGEDPHGLRAEFTEMVRKAGELK